MVLDLAMGCLNCFTPSKSPESRHRLDAFRDLISYNIAWKASRSYYRPPTPYPFEAYLAGELVRSRREHTAPCKPGTRKHIFEAVTVVRQRRSHPVTVEATRGSWQNNVRSVSYNEDVRIRSARRRSISFQKPLYKWDGEFAPRSDKRPVTARKTVSFQEPLQRREHQERITAQNGINRQPVHVQRSFHSTGLERKIAAQNYRINKRTVPVSEAPPPVPTDELSMKLARLRVGFPLSLNNHDTLH
jgi:hypothetical protein